MAEPFWLPDGVERGSSLEAFPPQLTSGRGLIVNETDLPNEVIETYIVENASVLGVASSNSYGHYMATGNIMTRPKWLPPQNIVEEIVMARELSERDDDVAGTMGMMDALAFGDGFQHAHRDEVTVAKFDKIAHEADITSVFRDMYREWIISSQVTTACLFREEQVQIYPQGADRARTFTAKIPMVGIIPAEQVIVLGNDLFGNAKLAYRPYTGRQEMWLEEFFGPTTSAARKSEMRREDPILTSILTGREYVSDWQGPNWVYRDPYDPAVGHFVYNLNPQYVQRKTAPKGQWQHPRPMMTRNAALLEAKRLLMIMDHALLEAGANFLIVAKKGSDQRPALPEEIANLRDTLSRASRSGMMVGDHRLNIEVITPNLTELLNPTKRNLIGQKMASALLRIPTWGAGDATGRIAPTDTEILARVIESDRRTLHSHMEKAIYKPTAKANGMLQGAPGIWFPKIILEGANFFQDYILGLRDRGDIPRKWAVEAAGFNWTAAVEQRKLEKSGGDDKVMTPAAVPFSSPNAGPQDRGGGRPAGAKTGATNPTAPGSGKRTIQQNAGETIKAMWVPSPEMGEEDALVRYGEQTYNMLEDHMETKRIGRISKFERAVLDRIESGDEQPFSENRLFAVPVNSGIQTTDLKAVRLKDGVSAMIGFNEEGAIVTRALVFSDEHKDIAEEFAARYGF